MALDSTLYPGPIPPHERDASLAIPKRHPMHRSVSQQSNEPEAPLRLLSLDGGGVKGYSSLLLLQEVMYRLFVEMHGRPPQMHEIPLPCDHFDLIGGVGTGGLIALMLGRLRMDIETVKEVWVKMTKRVFETDKTIVGIPYKTTLFKASKLESAIKEIVREYTIGDAATGPSTSSSAPDFKRSQSLHYERPQTRQSLHDLEEKGTVTSPSDEKNGLRKQSQDNEMDESNVKFDPLVRHKSNTESSILSIKGKRLGNPESLLFDPREDRCKTFVAAIYQNSPEGTPPCLLRTYLSQTTLNPEPSTKIWQAGRATAATLTAFKPIQIGQTVFLDEGAGRYNITPSMLEEATQNEWPNRSVGCVLSIGTGKPPGRKANNALPWWEGKIHTPFDNFADAKKRLISKTHLSEDIHQILITGGRKSGVEKWGISREDYYRLNVEIGVGDFAMNDWQRLAEISTNTRRWLTSEEGKRMVGECARKLAMGWRVRNILPPKSPLRPPSIIELPAVPMDSIAKPHPLAPTTEQYEPEEQEQVYEHFTNPRTAPVPPIPSHYQQQQQYNNIPAIPARSRTIHTQNPTSMPKEQFIFEDTRVTQPRPVTPRSRSQTQNGNQSQKGNMYKGVVQSKSQYVSSSDGLHRGKSGYKPGLPRRAMTEGRVIPPYPVDD